MDPIAEWTAAQQRVTELVRTADAARLQGPVPACPDWTVTQLLAHMVGLGVDVVAGDEADDHNAGWTQAQVDTRADASVEDLLVEWDGVADALRQWMGDNSPAPLGDVIIHEQDLRGALGVSGAKDTDGLHAIRDFVVGGFGEQVASLPTVELRSPTWTFTSGDGEPAVVVEAEESELFRALTTRRSEAQLRSWTTKGDVGPYLAAFGSLGPLPTTDLSE